MSTTIDFSSLIGPVAIELLGEPTKKTSAKWTYGASGKVVVRPKKGNFSDFGAGISGGTLALIEHVHGCNRADAMRWLGECGFIPPLEKNLHTEIKRTFEQPLRVDDETSARNEDAIQRARWIWEHTTEARADHPYLIAKGIGLEGLPVRDYRGALVVPLYRANGEFAGIQFIQRDGTKRFNKGIQKAGAFATIGADTGEGRVIVEGLATGATVHAATGKQVIVALDAGNLAPVAQAIGRPGDVVAADNDNAPKHDDPCTRAMGTYGTGHRKALATALPVYMPHQPGADFNDVGVDETRATFARAPISALPTYDAWKIQRTETDERADKLLNGLSGLTEPKAAASMALTIAMRMATRSPHQYRLADIRQRIESASAPGSIHPTTLDAIMERLEHAQRRRHSIALDATRLPHDTWRGHHVERPGSLPTLGADDLEGVILVRSPMGSGKTQIIGRRAADLALKLGERFLAITHRRTLTREQANRIGTDHYGDLSRSQAEFAPSLATCLPSITREDHGPLIDNAGVLFIDEVAQCLRFIESEGSCRSGSASNAGVYDKLREIVSRARCVIAADAGADERTLRFLESCRPGERFRVIDVPAPHDAGITAEYQYGQRAPAAAVERALGELAGGGKVWIATEGKARAARLGELFSAKGYRTLAIHAENAGEPEQKAFMADADAESRQYDVVIASPVVSSGVSVEHRNANPSERFTLGVFIGGGFRITPADAAQQLRRVRYLDQFYLALMPNNATFGDQSAESAMATAERAAQIERTPIRADQFDLFVAGIRADQTNQRADFAAGLMWQLLAAGWSLRSANDEAGGDTSAAMTAASDAADAKRRAMIIAAPRLTDAEAAEIEREAFRSELQSATLEAHRVRKSLGLGLMPITDAVLDLWDEGAIVAKLDRFNAWQGLAPKETEAGVRLSARRHHHARVKAYRQLFDGIDITAPDALTPEVNERILDRLMAERDLYAHLGIASAKYAQYREDRHHNRMPMARPKSAAKEVGYLLERMGLETTSRQSSCTDTPHPYTGKAPICAATKAKPKRVRIYSVTAESLATMRHWAEKRAVARELVPADEDVIGTEPAAPPPAPDLDAELDDIPLPCAGPPAYWEIGEAAA